MNPVYSVGSTLFINEALVLANLTDIEKAIRLLFSESPSDRWQVNLDTLEHLDTAGALFLHQLPDLANQYESSLSPWALTRAFTVYLQICHAPS